MENPQAQLVALIIGTFLLSLAVFCILVNAVS